MSAHNAATLAYAKDRTEWLAKHLSDNPASKSWKDTLMSALDQPTGGTIKSWMQKNAHGTIETFQAVLKLSGATVVDARSLWASGPRKMTALASTYVSLDDSQRDFRGVTTLTAGDIYVGYAKHGDDAVQLIAYRVS